MTTNLRKKRLAKLAKTTGCDALLITHAPAIRYLCGFTGSSGVFAMAGTRTALITDGRYTEQAKSEVVNTKVVIAPRSPLVAACAWIEASGATRCGFDPEHTTVAALSTMRGAISPRLRRSFFQPAPDLLGRMREIKDTDEISVMREAAGVGCELFDGMLAEIGSSRTEVEIAVEMERRARVRGAERMSFETIVAGGARSALPHAHPTLAKLPRRGFVVLDFGVVWKGYCSDMTRSVHMGRVSLEARAVYDSVLEAQMCAIERVAPGVATGEVDEAAREVLRRSKLDVHFTHSTGHGVGLEIHEQPRIGARQSEELRPGMVITIEPGVYLEGRFGVRIEDMVLVTDRGHEVLTTSTKALIEL